MLIWKIWRLCTWSLLNDSWIICWIITPTPQYLVSHMNHYTEIAHGSLYPHCNTLCRTYEWVLPFICMRNMTHSYVWQTSCYCATWCICMCNMTHSYVWHNLFFCVTLRIGRCNMSHPDVPSLIQHLMPHSIVDASFNCFTTSDASFNCFTTSIVTWLSLRCMAFKCMASLIRRMHSSVWHRSFDTF